jgi:hypothetical protein
MTLIHGGLLLLTMENGVAELDSTSLGLWRRNNL